MRHFSLLTFIVFTLAGCQSGVQKKEVSPAPLQNDLPGFQLITTNGQPIFAKTLSGKTIIILFQPDCDHCQREAIQIQENLEAFKSYQLYFVSDVTDQELIAFAHTYKLDDQPNIHFATTTADQIISNFGPLDTPSLFIYSQQGKLVHKFIGETDISKIVPAL